jgi:hypothetical protein
MFLLRWLNELKIHGNLEIDQSPGAVKYLEGVFPPIVSSCSSDLDKPHVIVASDQKQTHQPASVQPFPTEHFRRSVSLHLSQGWMLCTFHGSHYLYVQLHGQIKITLRHSLR